MRSFLFVPGDSERKLAKGPSSGPDGLILDLEDSVPFEMKAETRHMVAETIRDLARKHSDLGVYVRLNALETWCWPT